MNFYEKKNKKSVFSIKELASLLNVSESKIKELEKGERNISGDTLEEYLKFANMSANEKKIKRLELLNWFKNIDLKKLREEFGFKNQRALATKTGIAQSVISCIESGKNDEPTFLTLYKLNKFLTNDFNKEVKLEEEEENKHSSFEIPKECIVEAEHEMESSNVDEQNDLYTEEDLKLVEEDPTPTIISKELSTDFDFVSVKKDYYEDMQAKIKRYEKIIDYILKSEN